MLRKLAATMGGVDKTTPNKVSSYLAEIAGNRSIATRNRTQSAFSRFFSWAVDTGRTRMNPMERIKRLTEPRITDIVYCTPLERAEIIDVARETEWPEWIAVPVAFYAGMRREEVANLQWEDVHLQHGTIVTKETKSDELHSHIARIGWNSFRHTFGSLLAQAGVGLDKISAWMGNTPEVCRRHYAQFIPRDRRDGEIDKL